MKNIQILPAKIVAVVPTFNRLQLLKECVIALRAQTRPVDVIVIVNNGSSDGTRDWLDVQSDLHVVHQANVGGAGGFFSGQRYALEQLGADAVWCMDDDTIPSSSALEALLAGWAGCIEQGSVVGWICSLVRWTDGSIMNRPSLAYDAFDSMPEFYSRALAKCFTCTFVSVLISRVAIVKAGYVRAEMIYQGDDTEHTGRIVDAGFSAWVCVRSEVLHKAAFNPGLSVKYEGKNKMRMRNFWINLFDLSMLGANKSRKTKFFGFLLIAINQLCERLKAVDFLALVPALFYIIKGVLRRRTIVYPSFI